MSYSDDEIELIDNIEEYGCQVTFVFDPKGSEPDFSFSIGFLKTINQADVIIIGLERRLMNNMINEVMDQCKKGLVLSEGLSIDDLIEGFSCVARKVHASQIDEYFGSAIWYYRNEMNLEFKDAYQIVWPGAVSGQYPWDEGCDPAIIESQPALYEIKG